MGGSATIIKGTADARAITRRPGFLQRLFGRSSLNEVDLGNGLFHIDLPAQKFQFLGSEFKAHLRTKFEDPWPATSYLMDYLDIAVEVFVRGLREGQSPPQWYLQVMFSGCAGMAQTSSELAAHWANTWFLRETHAIKVHLEALGFFAESLDEEAAHDLLFLPLGDIGYASFSPTGWSPGEGEAPVHFEVDGALYDADDAAADELISYLEQNQRGLMSDGRCRCQMCCPNLDRSFVEQLPFNP